MAAGGGKGAAARPRQHPAGARTAIPLHQATPRPVRGPDSATAEAASSPHAASERRAVCARHGRGLIIPGLPITTFNPLAGLTALCAQMDRRAASPGGYPEAEPEAEPGLSPRGAGEEPVLLPPAVARLRRWVRVPSRPVWLCGCSPAAAGDAGEICAFSSKGSGAWGEDDWDEARGPPWGGLLCGTCRAPSNSRGRCTTSAAGKDGRLTTSGGDDSRAQQSRPPQGDQSPAGEGLGGSGIEQAAVTEAVRPPLCSGVEGDGGGMAAT